MKFDDENSTYQQGRATAEEFATRAFTEVGTNNFNDNEFLKNCRVWMEYIRSKAVEYRSKEKELVNKFNTYISFYRIMCLAQSEQGAVESLDAVSKALANIENALNFAVEAFCDTDGVLSAAVNITYFMADALDKADQALYFATRRIPTS
jgi:hypothetical protein